MRTHNCFSCHQQFETIDADEILCKNCKNKSQEMSNEEIKFIETPFQKVSIKPDDVIVFSHPAALSEQAAECIKREAKRIFPDNKIVILEEGLKIGVVEKTKIEGVDFDAKVPEFELQH